MVIHRPARPTVQDAQVFSSLYAQATLNMMHLYLGRRAYTILERLFPLSQHDHSYDITTLAASEDKPVGLLMGYSAAAHQRMTQRTLNLYLRYGLFGLMQSVPSILRLRPLRVVTGSLPSEAYYVKGLAVDPDYRRQGIGQGLLQEAEAQALRAGCTCMVLDVRTHNTVALRLYEGCGYHIVGETPSLRVNGETIAFYRMEKGL